MEVILCYPLSHLKRIVLNLDAAYWRSGYAFRLKSGETFHPGMVKGFSKHLAGGSKKRKKCEEEMAQGMTALNLSNLRGNKTLSKLSS